MTLRTAASALPPFAACAQAFESEFDFVYRTLRRLGIRGTDTEDLAQEVFLVLWRRWGEYQPSRSLRAWLAGIAVKVASRHHRTCRRRAVPRENVDPADQLPGPEDQLASSRARALVLRGLGSLSEKYRTVLVLHELDDLPVRDIAAALELPLFTVHTRLRRGRLKLAQWLSRQEAPLAAPELLALERRPLAAPVAVRDRARARLRALAVRPPLPVAPPAPLAAAPWLAWAALGLAMVAGVAVIGRPWAHRTQTQPSLAAPAPDLNAGLLGHWSFEERSGALIARDGSGAGNHCVLRGRDPAAAWVDGARGRAIDLGSTGWLECLQPPARAGGWVSLSVSAWVKRDRAKPGAVIASRPLGPAGQNFFHFGFADNQLRVWGHSWRGWTARDLATRETDWMHVAFTHEGRRTRLFVGGRLVAHDDDHGIRGTGTATAPLILGGSAPGAGIRQHLDGALDEVRLYDRALSDAEIAALSRR